MSDKPFSLTRFWEDKTLGEMTSDEWEALCDGCASCCVHKEEDVDTGQIHYTTIACRHLDIERCRCTVYDERKDLVPDCATLSPANVPEFHWLPETCAYRRLAEGRPLPAWHPLLTGDPESGRNSAVSARGRVVSEAPSVQSTPSPPVGSAMFSLRPSA